MQHIKSSTGLSAALLAVKFTEVGIVFDLILSNVKAKLYEMYGATNKVVRQPSDVIIELTSYYDFPRADIDCELHLEYDASTDRISSTTCVNNVRTESEFYLSDTIKTMSRGTLSSIINNLLECITTEVDTYTSRKSEVKTQGTFRLHCVSMKTSDFGQIKSVKKLQDLCRVELVLDDDSKHVTDLTAQSYEDLRPGAYVTIRDNDVVYLHEPTVVN